MAHELLATFYVQSPSDPQSHLTVTAEVHTLSENTWTSKRSIMPAESPDFDCEFYIETADVTGDSADRRYAIKVYRYETSTSEGVYYYQLYKAGIYKRRLRVLFKRPTDTNAEEVLTRMLYITIAGNTTFNAEFTRHYNQGTWTSWKRTLNEDDIVNTSDFVTVSGTQTITGTKTFSTSPVVPNKTSAPSTSGTAILTEGQGYNRKSFYVWETASNLMNISSISGMVIRLVRKRQIR